MDRPQEDGPSNRNVASGVDPAGLQAAERTLAPPLPGPIADQTPDRPEGVSAPEPVTDSPTKQLPQQELVSDMGSDRAAVVPDSPVSVQQTKIADGQVHAVPPSAPVPRSDPSLTTVGDLAATASDSTHVVPNDAGSGPGTETVSSDMSAEAVAPDPQIDLPLPATVDSRADGESDSRSPDREAPRADPDGDGLGQLERQLEGLSLDVEKQDDHLVANLGRSVRFSDGSAILDATARDALKRIAELLKDPMNAKVRVIGHTDSSGSESRNQSLSDLRARVVVRYLAANGVSAARLTHQGRGKSKPKVAAEQEQIQGPEINRRIELEVFGPDRNPD
jgi:outer membrane protein OmpA-like peptidoglycan-associated protein